MAARGNNLTQRRREAEAVRTVPLGDVVKIDTSVSFPKASKIWLLNLDMIEQQTGRVIDYVFVEPDAIGGSTVGFDKECVLYSKLRPNLNKVVLPDRCGVATSEILPLRCSSDSVSREYICWYLRSPDFVLYAINRTAGAKMPRLGTKDLLKAIVPLPSLSEQKRIAATLDRICELKKNAETRLAKLDLLVKSRFVEMFGDFANDPRISLGDACEFVRNGANIRQDKSSQGIPITRIETLSAGKFNPNRLGYANIFNVNNFQHHIMKTGDLLISHINSAEFVGRTVMYRGEVHGPLIHGMNLLRARLNYPSLTPLFVEMYLNTSVARRYFRSVTKKAVNQASISSTDIKRIELPLPPLALQREFAAFVEKVEKLKECAKRSAEQMDVLYRSKLQEYFG